MILVKTELAPETPVIDSAWKKPMILVKTELEPETPVVHKLVIDSAWKKPMILVKTELAPETPVVLPTLEITRVEAIETLSNPVQIGNKLANTRMCNSVNTGRKCPHGNTCRFAHNEQELVKVLCIFGKNCRFVKQQEEGIYISVKGKYCNRMHPGETNESILARTERPLPTTKLAHKVITPTPLQIAWQKQTLPLEQKAKTLLRVPKELALQAMELTIKLGKTNISLEFI